jgi:hypothetical protein
MAGLFVSMLFGAAPPAVDAQEGSKSVRDGVYTKAQATRGAAAFEARCLSCHGDPKFPASTIDNYDGTPAAELFGFMSKAMPEDTPGSLRPEEYADILAHFVSARGLPPGEAELPADLERLKQIRIEKPAP